VKRTVTVLQDDIDNGRKGIPHQCAIARAAKRDLADLMGESGFVRATGRLSLHNRPGGVGYLMGVLPCEAVQFISHFDDDLPVEPFKFEVELREYK
jgi:hypothetical protein